MEIDAGAACRNALQSVSLTVISPSPNRNGYTTLSGPMHVATSWHTYSSSSTSGTADGSIASSIADSGASASSAQVIKLTQLPSAGPTVGKDWLVCLTLRATPACGTWEQLCQGEAGVDENISTHETLL
jgi:hypothetical protein